MNRDLLIKRLKAVQQLVLMPLGHGYRNSAYLILAKVIKDIEKGKKEY